MIKTENKPRKQWKTRITLADLLPSNTKYQIDKVFKKNGRVVAGNLFSALNDSIANNNLLVQMDEKGYVRKVRVKVGEGFKWMSPYIKGFEMYLADESTRMYLFSYDTKLNVVI